jgi:perosamine synthetase
MTELQAAIGLAQLAKLDGFLADRRKLASRYHAEFSTMGLDMPSEMPAGRNSYFLFTLMLQNRDAVAADLKRDGIETRICYPIPLYDQPIFRKFQSGRCPVSENACASALNLPMFFGMTAGQQQRIVQALQTALSHGNKSARTAA